VSFHCAVGPIDTKPAIQSWISQRKLPAREAGIRLELVNPKTVDSRLWPLPRSIAEWL
jgi:hypothetical protein